MVQSLAGARAAVPPRPSGSTSLAAVRYVDRVTLVDELADRDRLPANLCDKDDTWAVYEADASGRQAGVFAATTASSSTRSATPSSRAFRRPWSLGPQVPRGVRSRSL